MIPTGISLVSPPRISGPSRPRSTGISSTRAGLIRVGTASENIKVTKLSFSDQRREIALSIVHAMLATLAAERVSEVNRWAFARHSSAWR